MDVTNSFYDSRLKQVARNVMISHLLLYLETAIRLDMEYPPQVVANANLMLMELEDPKNLSDERLMFLYGTAVSEMGCSDRLVNFVKIPMLFMKDKVDDR